MSNPSLAYRFKWGRPSKQNRPEYFDWHNKGVGRWFECLHLLETSFRSAENRLYGCTRVGFGLSSFYKEAPKPNTWWSDLQLRLEDVIDLDILGGDSDVVYDLKEFGL